MKHDYDYNDAKRVISEELSLLSNESLIIMALHKLLKEHEGNSPHTDALIDEMEERSTPKIGQEWEHS